MSEELKAVRKRILMDWQVQRGTNAWAPWGESGWSAVHIKKPLRKRAEGFRVKPHNGEKSGKRGCKVAKDRLIKRNPDLKGKDRPKFSPDEVFAHMPKPVKKPKPAEPGPEVEATEALEPKKGKKLTDWREFWISHFVTQKGMSREEAEHEYDNMDDDW